jgi:6-phosphogluconolactonase
VLRRFATEEELYRAAAEEVTRAAREAIAARGRFSIALAGGSTPRKLYELLAAPPYRDAVDWRATDVFFGDERAVPPDHADSNYRMAHAALLAHVPGRVHRIRGEQSPTAAARDYEGALVRVLGDPPVLDLALLGLGKDGHTASLFPRDAALEATGWAAPAQGPTPRVTLTARAFDGARRLLFLVSGADKAAALRDALDGSAASPAHRVGRDGARTLWLTDRAAAALVPEKAG